LGCGKILELKKKKKKITTKLNVYLHGNSSGMCGGMAETSKEGKSVLGI
jgi:hypothetical protein